MLIFSASLEFQFKILTAEKGIKFLIPEFLLANAVIEINAPDFGSGRKHGAYVKLGS